MNTFLTMGTSFPCPWYIWNISGSIMSSCTKSSSHLDSRKKTFIFEKQKIWSEITSNLWICCLPGLQSSRSNPSIQATLNKIALSSSLNSHPQTSVANASALHPSLRLFSLSNPSLPTTNLSGPSRRRQPPVSPLTLSPGPEAHQGFSRQLSSTSPLNPYPASQVKTDTQTNY